MASGSLALLYFLLGFHGGRQGAVPDRGQSPVECGDFLYVRPSVRPSVWLNGPEGGTDGRTYVRTDGRTDIRTENLPILQDFVPYRGRCPVRHVKKI